MFAYNDESEGQNKGATLFSGEGHNFHDSPTSKFSFIRVVTLEAADHKAGHTL
jgi:hypothetical protein